jgi:hypothetical protein
MKPCTGHAAHTIFFCNVTLGQGTRADTNFQRKQRMTWAALIKCVYEVDPLKCPKCGGTMKVISFIEQHQEAVIEKILRHCGLWKESAPRPPPKEPQLENPHELVLDYEFFDQEVG